MHISDLREYVSDVAPAIVHVPTAGDEEVKGLDVPVGGLCGALVQSDPSTWVHVSHGSRSW